MIQAVAIAELDGHTDPNPYGHLPFVDRDPARPAVKDGANNDYWDHVDFIVDKANSLGLWVGFLPTWGRYWHDTRDNQRPIFNRENAAAYGEWLGKRYRDKKLIWILGGDRAIDSDDQKEIIRAMASGTSQRRRRRAPANVSPSGRQRLLDLVSQRRLARFQHAAERARGRVHRPLLRNTR